MLRYSCDVNGYTGLVLTKLDILSGLPELKIAVGYEVDGQHHDYPPSTVEEIARATPIYETLAGWSEDVSAVRKFEDLPQAAQAYINRISQLCDVPISMISVGPERDQLIIQD